MPTYKPELTPREQGKARLRVRFSLCTWTPESLYWILCDPIS